MKFKIDENLPREFAELLRAVGHDALTVLDQGLVGATDPEILVRCQEERRALITLDLDFSDLRTYPPSDYLGLVVFRVRSQDKKLLINTLSKVIPLLDLEPLANHLWIVEEARVRIRGDLE